MGRPPAAPRASLDFCALFFLRQGKLDKIAAVEVARIGRLMAVLDHRALELSVCDVVACILLLLVLEKSSQRGCVL